MCYPGNPSGTIFSLQHAGLRRGDIVVALRRAGDGGGRVLDVRWETCRRVAELVVHDYMRRRRRQGSGTDGAAVQLKVVTPVVAASDGYASTMTAVMDPNKVNPAGVQWGGALFESVESMKKGNFRQLHRLDKNAFG